MVSAIQDLKESLRDMVSKNYILTIKDLKEECDKFNLEPHEDILAPMGWNCCDRCGQLGDSELDFLWVEGFDWEDDNTKDNAILKAIAQEGEDYCAICWECVEELAKKGGYNGRQ